MDKRELEVNDLKKIILELTNNIFSNVISVDVLSIDDLLDGRAEKIKQLIAISSADDAPLLVEYLTAIKRLDEEIIQAIAVKRDMFALAMANADKIHQYSNI